MSINGYLCIISLHHQHCKQHWMRAIAIDVTVQLGLCMFGTRVNCAKMAEQIDVPFR